MSLAATGNGFRMVAAYARIHKSVIEEGFPDDLHTYLVESSNN